MTDPFSNNTSLTELQPTTSELTSSSAPPGLTLQRMGADGAYATAIQVQKPRQMRAVERQVLQEAMLAGERGYYSWKVKDRDGRTATVEGISATLATRIAAVYGNCAVVDSMPVRDSGADWIFTSAFIDLETGFTLTRQFRQSKKSSVHGRLDDERKADIRFQIGQSKATRNVILHAMPIALTQGALEAAKKGVRDRIERYIASHGIENARQLCLSQLGNYGVSTEAALNKLGRTQVGGITLDDLVILRGDLTALMDGAEDANSLFPIAGDQSIPAADKLRETLEQKAPAAIEPPPKRKRGRPRKAATETPAPTPRQEPQPVARAFEQELSQSPQEMEQKTPEAPAVAREDAAAARRALIRELYDKIPAERQAAALQNVGLDSLELVDMIDDTSLLGEIRDVLLNETAK